MAHGELPDIPNAAERHRLLAEARHAAAQQRLARLNGEGRIVDVTGTQPPPSAAEWTAVVEQTTAYYGQKAIRRRRWDQALFLIELLALVGLGMVAANLWQTNRELNADLAAVQRAQVAQIAQLQAKTQQTATAVAQAATVASQDIVVATRTAVITSLSAGSTQVPTPAVASEPTALGETAAGSSTAPVVVAPVILPGGHHPPEQGEEPVPGEAGDVPGETLAALLTFDPVPTPSVGATPTPGAELALRIRIPAIGVDHPIVQGDDWEQLKLGVGQTIGSADPGEAGNVVLSAHNDIYGEIFRHLERLASGNEIIISTASRDYTYIVDDARILAPTDVWVMAPTERAQVTLISCFPYRINTHRIAIFAHLLEPAG